MTTGWGVLRLRGHRARDRVFVAIHRSGQSHFSFVAPVPVVVVHWLILLATASTDPAAPGTNSPARVVTQWACVANAGAVPVPGIQENKMPSRVAAHLEWGAKAAGLWDRVHSQDWNRYAIAWRCV